MTFPPTHSLSAIPHTSASAAPMTVELRLRNGRSLHFDRSMEQH